MIGFMTFIAVLALIFGACAIGLGIALAVNSNLRSRLTLPAALCGVATALLAVWLVSSK